MRRDNTEESVYGAWDRGPQGCWAVVKVGVGKSDEGTAENLQFSNLRADLAY